MQNEIDNLGELLANEKENVKTLKKERADLLAKLESMNIDNLNKNIAPSMSSEGEKELRNKIQDLEKQVESLKNV